MATPTICREGLVGIAWHGRYRGQKQLWFAARFEGEESEIDLDAASRAMSRSSTPGSGCRSTSLPTLVVPFKRQVYQGVIEQFERLRARRLDAYTD